MTTPTQATTSIPVYEKRADDDDSLVCQGCGLDCAQEPPHDVSHYFMLKDAVWLEATNNQKHALLCWDCTERNLGRRITADDLSTCPLNLLLNQRTRTMLDTAHKALNKPMLLDEGTLTTVLEMAQNLLNEDANLREHFEGSAQKMAHNLFFWPYGYQLVSREQADAVGYLQPANTP